MRIEKFGIVLSSLTENDIELVRIWRNKPHVISAMLFQEEISPEMQKRWFENLTENDYYFVLSAENRQIGVLHVKHIDWATKTGEAGIFIGEEEFLKTRYPIAGVLAMMDGFFDRLKLIQLTATVRSENTEIIVFNTQLGYEIIEENAVFTRLAINRERYLAATEKLRKVL